MKKRLTIGAFTLAAAINRFRRLNNSPQADQVIHNLVIDIAKNFPEDVRRDFIVQCSRNLNGIVDP